MSIFSEIVKEFQIQYWLSQEPDGSAKGIRRQSTHERVIWHPISPFMILQGQDSVTLSDFRGKKPVALVFGSFT